MFGHPLPPNFNVDTAGGHLHKGNPGGGTNPKVGLFLEGALEALLFVEETFEDVLPRNSGTPRYCRWTIKSKDTQGEPPGPPNFNVAYNLGPPGEGTNQFNGPRRPKNKRVSTLKFGGPGLLENTLSENPLIV